MSAQALLVALRRYWYLLLAGLVLGGLLGAGAMAVLPHRYSGSSVVLVSTPGLDPTSGGNDYLQTRMATYGELVTSRPVLDLAERSAGLPSGTLSAEDVSADVPPSTFVIRLTATSAGPEAAAEVANAVAQAFVTLAPNLDNPRRPVIAVSLIERALPQNSASTLSPQLPLLAGLVLGFTAGILVALVRSARPSRIKTADDAVQATGAAPLVAVSWAGTDGREGGLKIVPQGPRAVRAVRSSAEPFAALFSRLGLGAARDGAARGPRVVAVVSTEHRLEAAVVAAGLASTCRSSGQQCLVLAIDDQTHALLRGVASEKSDGASAGPVRVDLARRAGSVLTEAELRRAVDVVTPVPDLVIVPAPPVDDDPSTRTAVRLATEVLLALPLRSAVPRTAAGAAQAVAETGKGLAGTVLLVEERGRQEMAPPTQSWE